MLKPRVYVEDFEVDLRLRAFGATRLELIEVVRAVVGARADTVDDDPVTAEGQFAYIYGTRHLRALFKTKKWIRFSERNIESVRHPDRMLKLVYQSVDQAATDHHSPRAISSKGSGTDHVIDEAQGNLFSREQLEGPAIINLQPINTGVWFFCVSVDRDDVRAELSLPSAIENGNFRDFIERIFILRPGEWPRHKIKRVMPAEIAEAEPIVTRRKAD